jgi:TP901 family phage tail tape measure protein
MALGRGAIEIDLDARVDASDIARQVQSAEKKIRPLRVSLDDKGFRQPLGRITGDLGEFQNALDASVARTLAFGAAVGVVNSVANAFKGMVTSSIEVEKALTDVNVILNLTSSNLANFSKDLFEVARNTGQSFASVSEAAVELARQGLGAEETISRINDAMILTRLSGMDAAKSVATLTAAVNSYGDAAMTTTEVVNKLANVDAAFAVSTDDLANALARAGASAQGAKVGMDELLAAVTSVQQQTARGGAVIGNAFKSIFTRLSRSGVREALEEIGVATTDAAGNIRGAMSILQDYAGVYSTLTDSQRAYTDELVAGVFQINNLKAIIKDLGSDYSIYSRALDQSASSTDQATRRNEKLQGTLSALVNESAASVKELAASLGELVATPAIENLLTVFNSLSGALVEALDPEKGSSLIRDMFEGIGNFISGPGLALVGLAFVKLFKFVTGQSVKALGEVFKINTASQKTAAVEAKIGQILKNNEKLYHEISDEALTHEKREEMVLKTLQKQSLQYKAQQAMIAKLARSRSVGAALGGATGGRSRASGYIPNFANNIQGAISSERDAITAGEGGAGKGARAKVLNNFPIGGGRKETMVANTDEVIVPKFGGSSGSAIFNKDMIKKHGMPDGAIPVARGFIPSFAINPRQQRKEKEASKKAALLGDPKFKQFWNGSGHGSGSMTVDTQKSTQGFGIIGGRGSPGMTKSGIKGPLSNPDIKGPFVRLAAKGMAINSKEAEDFAKLYSGRMTQFTNIPVNTISNEPVSRKKGESMLNSPISNLIQPHMADAVEKIATKIYSNYFGRDFDTAGYIKGVRASVSKDNQIVSRSVEGGIMESALKLGNKESALNIGKDESATWDFEPGGTIPGYLKNQFFGSKKVIRADAKRTVSDSERGKVLKKATDEVFPAQLAGGILDSIDQRVLNEARESFARKKGKGKADGFIPSFITSIPDRFTAQGQEGAEKQINGLYYNKDGTLDGRFAYDIGGKMFKPAARSDISLETLKGTLMDLDNQQNPKLETVKEGILATSILRNANINHTDKHKALAQLMDFELGHIYEKNVSAFMDNEYAKNNDRIDFTNINWKKMAPFGPGPRAFTKRWGMADAFHGETHGAKKILAKLISAGLVPKGDIQKAASAGGILDLTDGKAGQFAEIAGKAGNDKPFKSNKNFSLSDQIFNKFNFPKPRGKNKGKKKKFGIKFNRDHYIANSGFIPNFANSLEEAISREKEALQTQGSSAKIYTDSDSRLKGPKNPMGLLVANTRDEPRGGGQGVERAIRSGQDPKTHGAAQGFVPNFAIGAVLKIGATAIKNMKSFAGSANSAGPKLKKLAEGLKKLGPAATTAGGAASKSSKATAAMAKQSAKATGVFRKVTGGAKKAFGGLGKTANLLSSIGMAGFGLEAVLQTAAPFLKRMGLEFELTMENMLGWVTDLTFGVDRELADSLANMAASMERHTQTAQKNIEGIDKFATSISGLNKALSSGDVTALGKFMENVIRNASELGSIDISGIFNAIGDPKALAIAVETAKKSQESQIAMNEVASDLASVASKVTEATQTNSSDAGAENVGKILEESDFASMAKKLVSSLPSEEINGLAEGFRDSSTAGSAFNKILEKIPLEVANGIKGVGTVTERLKVFVNSELQMMSATQKLAEALNVQKAAVKSLGSEMGLLSSALTRTSQSASDAFKILNDEGKIEAKGRSDRMSTLGTVSPQNMAAGQAAADLDSLQSGIANAVKETIDSFAKQIVEASKNTGISLSGAADQMVTALIDGSLSTSEAVSSLASVMESGSPEEKEAAQKTIETIRNIGKEQIVGQRKIESTLRSSSAAQDAAAGAFLRGNQLSESSLNMLGNLDSTFKEGTSVQKTQLERLSEQKQALDLMSKIGGGNDPLLNALQEQNKALTEFTNLKEVFRSLVGKESQATDLGGLQRELKALDITNLKDANANLIPAFKEAVTNAFSRLQEGGVKTKDEFADAAKVKIDPVVFENLANELAKGISDPLRELTGIPEAIADKLNINLDVESLAQSLKETSETNKTSAAEIKKNLAEGMKILAQSMKEGLAGVKLQPSADAQMTAAKAQAEAATAMNAATAALKSKPGSASGFVPNYAPHAAVARALGTERAMGGAGSRPVVDYHRQVGTYVRDAATQPNFAAVKRDHPEGLKKATQNSRSFQGGASGFTPNFAPNNNQSIRLDNLKQWSKGPPPKTTQEILAYLERERMLEKAQTTDFIEHIGNFGGLLPVMEWAKVAGQGSGIDDLRSELKGYLLGYNPMEGRGLTIPGYGKTPDIFNDFNLGKALPNVYNELPSFITEGDRGSIDQMLADATKKEFGIAQTVGSSKVSGLTKSLQAWMTDRIGEDVGAYNKLAGGTEAGGAFADAIANVALVFSGGKAITYAAKGVHASVKAVSQMSWLKKLTGVALGGGQLESLLNDIQQFGYAPINTAFKDKEGSVTQGMLRQLASTGWSPTGFWGGIAKEAGVNPDQAFPGTNLDQAKWLLEASKPSDKTYSVQEQVNKIVKREPLRQKLFKNSKSRDRGIKLSQDEWEYFEPIRYGPAIQRVIEQLSSGGKVNVGNLGEFSPQFATKAIFAEQLRDYATSVKDGSRAVQFPESLSFLTGGDGQPTLSQASSNYKAPDIARIKDLMKARLNKLPQKVTNPEQEKIVQKTREKLWAGIERAESYQGFFDKMSQTPAFTKHDDDYVSAPFSPTGPNGKLEERYSHWKEYPGLLDSEIHGQVGPFTGSAGDNINGFINALKESNSVFVKRNQVERARDHYLPGAGLKGGLVQALTSVDGEGAEKAMEALRKMAQDKEIAGLGVDVGVKPIQGPVLPGDKGLGFRLTEGGGPGAMPIGFAGVQRDPVGIDVLKAQIAEVEEARKAQLDLKGKADAADALLAFEEGGTEIQGERALRDLHYKAILGNIDQKVKASSGAVKFAQSVNEAKKAVSIAPSGLQKRIDQENSFLVGGGGRKGINDQIQDLKKQRIDEEANRRDRGFGGLTNQGKQYYENNMKKLRDRALEHEDAISILKNRQQILSVGDEAALAELMFTKASIDTTMRVGPKQRPLHGIYERPGNNPLGRLEMLKKKFKFSDKDLSVDQIVAKETGVKNAGEYLFATGWGDLSDQERDKHTLFSKMRNDGGSVLTGERFAEEFGAAGEAERTKMLMKLGLRKMEKQEDNLPGQGVRLDGPEVNKGIQHALKQISSAPLSFLADQIFGKDGKKGTSNLNDVQKGMLLRDFQASGVPMSNLDPAAFDALKTAQIRIFKELGGGGEGIVGEWGKVQALEGADANKTKQKIVDIQIQKFRENIKKKKDAGGKAGPLSIVEKFLTSENLKALRNSPVYWNSDAYEKANIGGVQGQVQQMLNRKANWKNQEEWTAGPDLAGGVGYYGSMGPLSAALGGGTFNKKYAASPFTDSRKTKLVGPDEQDEPGQVLGERYKIPSFGGTDSLQKMIDMSYGKQWPAINEKFREVMAAPFPIPDLSSTPGTQAAMAAAHKAVIDAADTKTTMGPAAKGSVTGNQAFAPYGYKDNIAKANPAGNKKQILALYDAIKDGDFEKAENAAGFIPNFSAIAGEMAASKMAGYKSPVKPSQVKSMNIPGVGKMAYNTQESVFKMPGVTQPFIRPPADSKAASGYKGAVQKKFGFNPYDKAAGGFIPNFAPDNKQMLRATRNTVLNLAETVHQQFVKQNKIFADIPVDHRKIYKKANQTNAIVKETQGDLASHDYDVSSALGKIKAAVGAARGFVPNFSPTMRQAGQNATQGASEAEKAVKRLSFDFGKLVIEIQKLSRESSISTELNKSGATTGIRAARGFVPNFAVGGQSKEFQKAVNDFQSSTQNFSKGASLIDSSAKSERSSSNEISKSISQFSNAIRTFQRSSSGKTQAPWKARAAGAVTKVNLDASTFNSSTEKFNAGVSSFGTSVSSLNSSVNSFKTAREEFGKGVASFGNQVGNLESSLSRLDFSSLTEASSIMKGAATTFSSQADVIKTAADNFKSATDKTTDTTDQPLDFAPFTSAAGSMESSIGSLQAQLEKPISLETASLEESLKDLSSALGNVQGTLAVEIPNVQVNVNGSEVADQIKQVIENNVRSLIQREIGSINWETKIGSVLS